MSSMTSAINERVRRLFFSLVGLFFHPQLRLRRRAVAIAAVAAATAAAVDAVDVVELRASARALL